MIHLLIVAHILIPIGHAVGFGYGALGALDCDVPFAPAAGTLDHRDDEREVNGQITRARAELDQILRRDTRRPEVKAQLAAINAKLSRLEARRRDLAGPVKSPLRRVLSLLWGAPSDPPMKAGTSALRYPGRPYLARLPNYYGVRDRTYGGIPGGIGRGAFAGCGGVAGLGLGGQYVAPAEPFLNQRGRGVFAAAIADASLDPRRDNGLLNPGFNPSSDARGDEEVPAPTSNHFGFIEPPPPHASDARAETPRPGLSFDDVSTGLVNRPVIGVTQARGDEYVLSPRLRIRYVGDALFRPIFAGPALGGQTYNAPTPTSLAKPPSIR